MARRHPRTSVYVLATLLQLSLSNSSTFAAQSDQQIEVDAPIMELTEDGFSTRGPTTIRIKALRATGAALKFDRATGLFELDGPLVLQRGPYTLRATALSWTQRDRSLVLKHPSVLLEHPQPLYVSAGEATCSQSGCRLENAALSSCQEATSCSFRIDSIRVEPDHTVVLHSATLRLGRVPVLYLPWLKLMPSHKPGLLPPKVAYFPDTGLVLGPGLYVPVLDRGSLEVFAAGRFAGGAESSAALFGPAGHLQLEYGYLHSGHHHSVRARSQAQASFSHGSAAVDLDIVNHFDAISQSTFWPEDKIRSHNASRARTTIVSENFSFEPVILALQPFAEDGSISQRSLHVRTGFRANVIALPVGRGVFADLRTGVYRLGLMTEDPIPDAANAPAQAHNRFDVQPTLAWSHHLGPLAARASLGTEHRIWLTDSTSDHQYYHAGIGTAELSLPLAKRIGNGFHWIEPAIRYRNNLLAKVRAPPYLFTYLDQPRVGQGIDLVFHTHIETLQHSRLLDLSVAQRFDIGSTSAQTADISYLHWKAAFGPPTLRLTWHGAFDERRRVWSWQRVSLRTASSMLDVNLGYEYVGSGLGPHRDRPELHAAPWPDSHRSVAGAYGSARLKLPIGLQLRAGAHLSLPPAESTRLNALFYGAVYRTPCPFIRLGLYVSHFGASLEPSAMLVLTAS